MGLWAHRAASITNIFVNLGHRGRIRLHTDVHGGSVAERLKDVIKSEPISGTITACSYKSRSFETVGREEIV